MEETEITSTGHNPLTDFGAATRMLGALFSGAKVYGKAGAEYVGSVPGKLNSRAEEAGVHDGVKAGAGKAYEGGKAAAGYAYEGGKQG